MGVISGRKRLLSSFETALEATELNFDKGIVRFEPNINDHHNNFIQGNLAKYVKSNKIPKIDKVEQFTQLNADKVVDAIYELKPIDFTLWKLFSFVPNAPTFGKFLIVQKLRECLASPFEDLIDRIHKLSQLHALDVDSAKSPFGSSSDHICLGTNIATLMEEGTTNLSIQVVHHLNKVLKGLQETLHSRQCKHNFSRVSCGDWRDLVDLLEPLEERPFKISKLLPAMEWMREHPDGVIMTGFAMHKMSNTWTRRWEMWSKLASECWAIKEYVDPAFVFLEEAEGTVFAEVINSANRYCAHTVPRLPEPALLEVHQGFGSSPTRLRRFTSTEDATKVASRLRNHLAIPGNVHGGGNGPAARICTFSCFNMVWW